MKSAYALLRKGKVFIQSYSRTVDGLRIASGPVHVIEENQPNDLDVKIRDALSRSMEGVPHPRQSEWKTVQAPMLQAAGVKSWSTLAKGAKAVGLEWNGSVVTIVPSSGYENKGGTSLTEKTIICELESSRLGSALLEAFYACE